MNSLRDPLGWLFLAAGGACLYAAWRPVPPDARPNPAQTTMGKWLSGTLAAYGLYRLSGLR